MKLPSDRTPFGMLKAQEVHPPADATASQKGIAT
jgi:hypothetical protein